MARSEAGKPMQCREIKVSFGPEDIRSAIEAAYGDRIVGGIEVTPGTLSAGATFVAKEPEDSLDISPLPQLEVATE